MQNYFSDKELQCRCGCGENKFSETTKEKLNNLRHALGFAMVVTSGYRCPKYNDQIGATQTHASGQAVDIAVSHKQAYDLVALAPEYGFTGLGINQRGNARFVHLDDLPADEGRPRPHIWSYA
jgi:uncharacterized protein YcbK (DUF882 family)